MNFGAIFSTEWLSRLIVLLAPSLVIRSQVTLNTGNGRGAVRTNVYRWSVVKVNQGTDITYTDDANNGAEFLINTNGLYAITWVPRTNANSDDVITANQLDQFTTSPGGFNVTNQQKVIAAGFATAGSTATMTIVLELQALDIIRAISLSADSTSNFLQSFTITKIGN